MFSDYDFDSETASRAMVRAFGRHGLRPPTLRAIAEETNGSVAALHSWFGSKAAMMPRAAEAYAAMFGHVLHDSVVSRGWDGFVPDDSELLVTRALLAWEELARTDEAVAVHVARCWDSTARLLREADDVWPVDGGRDLDLLGLVLRGLWAAMCSGTEPLGGDAALERWRAVVAAGPRSSAAG